LIFTDVAFGSIVTLKNHKTGGGYLHSHWHLYPENVGPKQQQVLKYMQFNTSCEYVFVKWFVFCFHSNLDHYVRAQRRKQPMVSQTLQWRRTNKCQWHYKICKTWRYDQTGTCTDKEKFTFTPRTGSNNEKTLPSHWLWRSNNFFKYIYYYTFSRCKSKLTQCFLSWKVPIFSCQL